MICDRTLVNIDEISNYEEVMAALEASKWKEGMESEIHPMYHNQVCNLVDPPLTSKFWEKIDIQEEDWHRWEYTYIQG